MQSYNVKTIVAGKYGEVRTYPRARAIGKSALAPNRGSDTRVGGRSTVKEKSGILRRLQQHKRRIDNVKRAKDKIKYLVHANTTAIRPIFVTLTYRDNVKFRSRAQTDVGKFFRTLRRKYPNLSYLYVFEKQRRGAYHAHVVIFSHTYIPINDLEEAWPPILGSTNVRRVDSSKKTANYLGKYLGKDETNSENLRSYSRSRNLTEAEITYGMSALLNAYRWTLEKETQYGTINGAYKITIYTDENSG